MLTNENALIYVIVLIAIFLAAWALYKQRKLPELAYASPETREQQFMKKVGDLESTVKILLENSRKDQDRITTLEKELFSANNRIRDLENKLSQYEGPRKKTNCNELLVGIGEDVRLKVDLAKLRKVQRLTGLRITRLLPVSYDNLKRTLARRRETGEPIQYLHLGVHAGPNGLVFSDRIVNGVELSEILKDIQVLVIAGCSADQIGDLLGVIPAIITLREDVSMEDAASMTEVFWTAIGEGLDAEDAFFRTTERCASISEFVELHQ